MASKKGQTRNNEPASTEAMPDGFTPRADKIEGGWIKPAEGLIVQGHLLGRFTMRGKGKNKVRNYYKVRLTAPCVATCPVGDGDWEDGIQCKAGDIVNLDERTAIECLANDIASGKKLEIWLKYIEKKSLDSGQTFWQTEFGTREVDFNSVATSAANDAPSRDDN